MTEDLSEGELWTLFQLMGKAAGLHPRWVDEAFDSLVQMHKRTDELMAVTIPAPPLSSSETAAVPDGPPARKRPQGEG